MAPDTVASTTGAVAAGAGSYLLASLGLEPAPMFWALVGSVIGMSFAGEASRARAVIVFVAVVLICSLFGSWLAQRYFAGDQMARNVLACVLALAFHPLFNGAITQIPKVLSGWASKIGGGTP